MLNLRRTFDSLEELISQAADPTRPRWNGGLSWDTDPARAAFTGAPSVPAAVELARKGWPEGRARMVAGLDEATTLRPAPAPSRSHSVAGAFPDVPRHIAGDPESMIDLGNQIAAQRPIVRMAFNAVASAAIEHEAIINRGVALLSAIDELESAGFSVELAICWATENSGRLQIDVIAKRAGEPLELDRMAFILAHPAFLRRILFSVVEQDQEALRAIGPTKGHPVSPELDPGVIYVPHVHKYDAHRGAWDRIETAVPLMREVLRTAGAPFLNPDAA